MKKLYEKNAVLCAVIWIVIYCAITIPIRGTFGDGSPFMLIALAAIAAGITLFVKTCRLNEACGLTFWPKDGKKYLYFIPMWVLVTGNLWGGIYPTFAGINQIFAILSMLIIGYVEEMIFRGFLFKSMIPKDGIRSAVIVSAVTFGIGHIVNLLAGQANLETVIQVFFAIAWGFIFTMVYYKSGSLLPCILAHGLVNTFAEFGSDATVLGWIYMSATIFVAIFYCLFLLKLPDQNPTAGK